MNKTVSLTNLEELKKQSKLNLTEKIMKNIKEQNKLITEKISKFLKIKENQSFIMSPLNKFRSYVIIIISCYRLINLKSEISNLVKFETLKTFQLYYQSIDEEVKKWFFSSILQPYASVNF